MNIKNINLSSAKEYGCAMGLINDMGYDFDVRTISKGTKEYAICILYLENIKESFDKIDKSNPTIRDLCILFAYKQEYLGDLTYTKYSNILRKSKYYTNKSYSLNDISFDDIKNIPNVGNKRADEFCNIMREIGWVGTAKNPDNVMYFAQGTYYDEFGNIRTIKGLKMSKDKYDLIEYCKNIALSNDADAICDEKNMVFTYNKRTNVATFSNNNFIGYVDRCYDAVIRILSVEY